jgi:hypothetical protein
MRNFPPCNLRSLFLYSLSSQGPNSRGWPRASPGPPEHLCTFECNLVLLCRPVRQVPKIFSTRCWKVEAGQVPDEQ